MSKRSRSPEAEVGMNLNLNLNRSPAWSSTEESVSSAIVGGSSWLSSLSLSSSSSSSDMSCEGEEGGHVRYSSSDHEIITRSMALVGCPGCFMYVMLTEKSSQCPKCKNNVFLDFFKHHHKHGCKN